MKKLLTISFLFMFVFIATGIIFAQNSYTFKNANHSWMESPKVDQIYDLCSTSNKKSAIKNIVITTIDNKYTRTSSFLRSRFHRPETRK